MTARLALYAACATVLTAQLLSAKLAAYLTALGVAIALAALITTLAFKSFRNHR